MPPYARPAAPALEPARDAAAVCMRSATTLMTLRSSGAAWSMLRRSVHRPWRMARVSGPSTNVNWPAPLAALVDDDAPDGADESEPRSDLLSSERSARLMTTRPRRLASYVAAGLELEAEVGAAWTSFQRCMTALCLPDEGAPVTSVGTRRVTLCASWARSAECAGVETNASGSGVTAGAAACDSDSELEGPGAAGDVSEGTRPSRKTSTESATTTVVLPSSAGSNAPSALSLGATAGAATMARARSSRARTSSTMGRTQGSTPRRRTSTSSPPSTRRLVSSPADARTSSSPNPEGRRSSASLGEAGSAPNVAAYSAAYSVG